MPRLGKLLLWKLKMRAFTAAAHYHHTGERICAEVQDESRCQIGGESVHLKHLHKTPCFLAVAW